MNTYLTIITTALVVTQIIRLVQNAVQLRRQKKMIQDQLCGLDEITQKDIEMQRKAYQAMVVIGEQLLRREGATDER